MTDVKRAAMASSLMATLASSSTIIQSIEESDINDLHGELALGQRIVTAAEHDRWKDIHEEISLDVECSAEQIIVYLKGVIPNQLFQLRDPGCKLKAIDRDTQAITIRPPTACGGSLNINSTHLIVHNEIIQPIATALAPTVLTGNIGCIFAEEEIRTSLFYKEPKDEVDTPIMLNDANAGVEWQPVKTYRGFGDNLIWARMNIYEDNNYETPYLEPPILTIRDNVHVGVELLKSPTEESYLLVRNCWAVPNYGSDMKLELIREGCMNPDLKKQGLDFEVTDNGQSHKITFNIPVLKFAESDTVHLECQVRACLNRSCQPKCASDRRLSAHTDTTVYENLNEYDEYLLSEAIQEYENEFEISEEIIYQDEPETDRDEPEVRELAAELADMTHVRAAMLKSANRFRTIEDDNPHNEHQITSIEFRIKHEPVEEPTGPFEGRLDPISLLLVTVLITSVLLLFGIISMLLNRRKKLHKQLHVST